MTVTIARRELRKWLRESEERDGKTELLATQARASWVVVHTVP